ncbi:MAG: hypothetical protein ABI193_23065 [Minicystis sp.]
MAAPAPGATCRFEGTTSTIEIAGEGQAKLIESDIFLKKQVADVTLTGAQIGPSLRNPRIERPDHLEPVALNKIGEPYHLRYESHPGSLVAVAIVEGERLSRRPAADPRRIAPPCHQGQHQ